MAHQPQAFRFQPPMSLAPHACGRPFSSGFVPGPGMDGPGWISSGPAYAPYSTSARSPQLYGGEIRPGAFVTPGYNPSARILMPGPYLHNDPMYRKYAKANPTHTLTAWLEDHLKHPYPTQSEKVMLAILTRMTLQEVSSWFAKARRPLRIENKIRRKWNTVKVDGGSMKTTHSGPWEKNQSAVPPPHCLMSRNGGGSGDKDPNWWPPLIPDPARNHAPPGGVIASEVELMSKGISGSAVQGSDPVPQPKLWSLPEMAKSQNGWAGPQAQMWTPYSHAPPQTLYYTPPFMSGYSGYAAVGNRSGASPLATTFEQIPADGAAAIRGPNPGPPTWRS